MSRIATNADLIKEPLVCPQCLVLRTKQEEQVFSFNFQVTDDGKMFIEICCARHEGLVFIKMEDLPAPMLNRWTSEMGPLFFYSQLTIALLLSIAAVVGNSFSSLGASLFSFFVAVLIWKRERFLKGGDLSENQQAES